MVLPSLSNLRPHASKIHNRLKPFLSYLLYGSGLLLLCIISFFYYQKATNFHFTDEFNSVVRAYFLQKGKLLYRDIFTHHQPMMVYLSYIIQIITNPDSLYKLILYHRVFIILFSFIANTLLLFRFRLRALAFVLLYETTNYYLFGSLFLAESLIVYPLVYLLALVWEVFTKKELAIWEYYAAGIAAWFVFFTREPYAPAALLLFGLLLLAIPSRRHTLSIFGLFALLSLAIISINPVDEYLYALITVNFTQYIPSEMAYQGTKGLGVIKVIFYPLVVFFTGAWSEMRILLIGISASLVVGSIILLQHKAYRKVLTVFFILSALAIRYVRPGDMFYEGFHLLPWYGVACMSVVLLLSDIKKLGHSLLSTTLKVFLAGIWIYILLVPPSYIFEQFDTHKAFHDNYGKYYIVGSTIKALSHTDDTLFIDYWSTLIFWESGLDSAYQYAMYWPVMSGFEKYRNARMSMFEQNPPDFYYAMCGDDGKNVVLEDKYAQQYVRLEKADRPSCLYIHKTKMPEITVGQWQKAAKFDYLKPSGM